jgi:hypothetical protein
MSQVPVPRMGILLSTPFDVNNYTPAPIVTYYVFCPACALGWSESNFTNETPTMCGRCGQCKLIVTCYTGITYRTSD